MERNHVQRLKPNLLDYLENTTIHGIKYLGDTRRPIIDKIFWICIFVLCFVSFGYFITQILYTWSNSPVILINDEIPTEIYKIPFPAVTICPEVKIKFDEFNFEAILLKFAKLKRDEIPDDIFTNQNEKFEIAQQVCNKLLSPKFSDFNFRSKANHSEYIDSSYIPFLYSSAPSLRETIWEANFISRLPSETTSHLFSTILTNEGVCFTFNMLGDILRNETIQNNYSYHNIMSTPKSWDLENGYKFDSLNFYPLNLYAQGKGHGLKLNMWTSRKNLNTICQPTNAGFKIMLHSPNVYPSSINGYTLINPEAITQITIKPTIIKASPSLWSYEPKRRNCYFNGEKQLKYFKYYTAQNCRLECQANATILSYGCVHFSSPMAPDVPICGSSIVQAVDYDQLYDSNLNTRSLLNQLADMEIGNMIDVHQAFTECDCLPECNLVEYEYSINAENFDYARAMEKLNVTKFHWLDNEVNLFYKDTRIIGKTRIQLYTLEDLISNFGGLMGLFLGASVVSLFELIYFCIVRSCC